MSTRYLRINEIVSFDISEPVLELFKSAKKKVIISDLFISCGQWRRVVRPGRDSEAEKSFL